MKTNLINKSLIALFTDLITAELAIESLEAAGFSRGEIKLYQRDNSIHSLADIVDLGLDKEELNDLENGFNTGHIIVTLMPTAQHQKALMILNENDAKTILTSNINSSTNQNVYDNSATSRDYSMNIADTINTDIGDLADLERKGIYKSSIQDIDLNNTESENKQKLSLYAEKLDISKESIESGEVVIRREIITEIKTIEVPVSREEMIIERHTKNKQELNIVDNIEILARIVISEEKINISKEIILKEKVEIKKIKVTENQTVSATLLHEELEINETGNVIIEDNLKDK